MSYSQEDSIFHLPLSWARTDRTTPAFDSVRLSLSQLQWFPLVEVPMEQSFEQLYTDHLSQLPTGFVLKSCPVPVRDYLIEQGCEAAPMGLEAILDLPWRGKQSVRRLARLGLRHGAVSEVECTVANQQKLAQLINKTPRSRRVRLRYTERPTFDASVRCFVLETPEHEWLGAITLSTNRPGYVHIELLLRHVDAPIGVMEALISTIAEQLTHEGFTQLSLSNVPLPPAEESEAVFAKHRHPQERWRLSQTAFGLGRRLQFAYNGTGLWTFKNKFQPRWEPVYLCASPRLSLGTIAGLAYEIGYVDLVRHQAASRIANALPNLSDSKAWIRQIMAVPKRCCRTSAG